MPLAHGQSTPALWQRNLQGDGIRDCLLICIISQLCRCRSSNWLPEPSVEQSKLSPGRNKRIRLPPAREETTAAKRPPVYHQWMAGEAMIPVQAGVSLVLYHILDLFNNYLPIQNSQALK